MVFLLIYVDDIVITGNAPDHIQQIKVFEYAVQNERPWGTEIFSWCRGGQTR